jgi:hypothetical protein
MHVDEFKFMLEKLITSFSALLTLKRSYFSEIYKSIEGKLLLSYKEAKIYRNDFVRLML